MPLISHSSIFCSQSLLISILLSLSRLLLPRVAEDVEEMELVSDQKPPKVSVRCISGARKVQLDFKSIDLNRHRRLTPSGSIRRALRVIADGGSTPLGDSGRKKEPSGISAACSSEGATATLDESVDRSQSAFEKSPVVSVDAADARKRKAEKDLSGSREWMHLEHMEGRPNPILRTYLLPAADLDNRKAIELAKERLGIDKENINPGDGYRRRQTRKQASDRSCAEKRGLKVSNRQHDAPGNDIKLGSLVSKLMTGDGKPSISEPSAHGYQPDSNLSSSTVFSDLPSKGLLQQISLADSMASSKTAEPISTVPYLSSPRTVSSIQHTENDVFDTCESMIILPPPLLVPSNCSDEEPIRPNGGIEEKFPELDMQLGSKPFIPAGSLEMPADMQITKVLVEASQVKDLPASVKELSSVMNFLQISDSHGHEDLHIPSLSEKVSSSHICDAKQRASNIQGQSLEEARCVLSMSGPVGELNRNQGFTGAPIATPAPCSPERQIRVGRSPHSSSCDALPLSSVPSTVANACSITVRNTSAPLAPFTSTSQPFTGENVQPLRKCCPSPADDILKPSQLIHVSLVSAKAQTGPLQEEGKHSPVKGAMAKGGKSEQGYGRSSQGAVLVTDGIVVKDAGLSEANNPSEKKAFNGGDVDFQTRKHGETEHFFWVNGRRYQKLKKIGSGGSSEVYKVIDCDCTIYALKRIKLKGRDYGAACGFYQEIEYLRKLCGQTYIVRLIDHEVTDQRIFRDEVEPSCIIKDDVYIYMVLEYGEVDLAHMLVDKWKERSQGKKDLDETWLRFYWHQILEAVNTIHDERIVHSDLKPANFLLVKGVLKLIDFGIAKAIQSDTTHIERESHVGTVNYMSPEAFLMNEKDEHGHPIKCGRPSDIWSLGCILYQMVYGTTPFAHITRMWAKVQEVTNPNHKINFPLVSNPYLLDIMEKCLAWKLEERLRIPELLNHPFLKPQSAKPVSYSCSKQQKENTLLQIQMDYKHDRDVSILSAKLLERLRMLETATDD